MSLKILGGRLRSLSMLMPPESLTRPTSTMLRRRIFDSRQDLSGSVFIDLCAGSGSVGLEAFSRGASPVYLIEKNANAFSIIKKNVASAIKIDPASKNILCEKSDTLKWLAHYLESLTNRDETIIFFDPPYEEKSLYEETIKLVINSGFAGEFWIESCRQKGFEPTKIEQMLGKTFNKVYWQGTSYLGICSFSKD